MDYVRDFGTNGPRNKNTWDNRQPNGQEAFNASDTVFVQDMSDSDLGFNSPGEVAVGAAETAVGGIEALGGAGLCLAHLGCDTLGEGGEHVESGLASVFKAQDNRTYKSNPVPLWQITVD
jgi:hypothetical protein